MWGGVGWWLNLYYILIRSGSNTVKISLGQNFSFNVVCVSAWQFSLCSRTSTPLSSSKSLQRTCSQIEKSLHTPTSSFYFCCWPLPEFGSGRTVSISAARNNNSIAVLLILHIISTCSYRWNNSLQSMQKYLILGKHMDSSDEWCKF